MPEIHEYVHKIKDNKNEPFKYSRPATWQTDTVFEPLEIIKNGTYYGNDTTSYSPIIVKVSVQLQCYSKMNGDSLYISEYVPINRDTLENVPYYAADNNGLLKKYLFTSDYQHNEENVIENTTTGEKWIRVYQRDIDIA